MCDGLKINRPAQRVVVFVFIIQTFFEVLCTWTWAKEWLEKVDNFKLSTVDIYAGSQGEQPVNLLSLPRLSFIVKRRQFSHEKWKTNNLTKE